MSNWRLKSLKSRGSSDFLRESSRRDINKSKCSHEGFPILFDHDQELDIMGGPDPNDPRMFLKAESRKGKDSDNNNNSLRQSSLEFWKDTEDRKDGKQQWQAVDEESPSMMSGRFFNKPNEIALDMESDLDKDFPTVSRDSRSRRVSFRKGFSGSPSSSNDPMSYQKQQREGRNERLSDDLSRRLSNSSRDIDTVHRSGLLSKLKSTKSRLIERPQEEVDMMSGLLGLRSVRIVREDVGH